MAPLPLIPLYNAFTERHDCTLEVLLINREFLGPFVEQARMTVGPLPAHAIAKMLLTLYRKGMIR